MRTNALHHGRLSTGHQSPETATDHPARKHQKRLPSLQGVCSVCVSAQETHVDAEGDQVVGVLEVVGDGLRQVEGQLDELKGRARICGGEDDPTSVVQHRDVCRQYHLGIQSSMEDGDGDGGGGDDDDVPPYRVARADADSKLLPYKSVVDPLGNIMEGFSIIRTGEKDRGIALLPHLPLKLDLMDSLWRAHLR